jgi:hypothetical protein
MTDCERMRALALDALLEGRQQPSEVAAHVQHCAPCEQEIRAQMSVWQQLGALRSHVPTKQQTERIARLLQQQLKTERKERTPMKSSWLVAAILAGTLLGGAGSELFERSSSRQAPGDQFLLLLHENPAQMTIKPEQIQAVVAEYTAWATGLRQENRLVSAEKLSDDGGRWLGPQGIMKVKRAESIGGFFLIRADSYEHALTIAQQSPHLKYGGVIEVRRIDAGK